MKYSNIAQKIKRVLFTIPDCLIILICLGLIGGFLWVDIVHGHKEGIELFSIFWFFVLPCALSGIHFFLGRILGDKWVNSGYVSEGRSVFNVVKTPKYYKRRMIISFISCILFFLLIIRYIFAFKHNTAIGIIGIIGSIIAIVLSYILAKSSIEQIGLQNK